MSICTRYFLPLFDKEINMISIVVLLTRPIVIISSKTMKSTLTIHSFYFNIIYFFCILQMFDTSITSSKSIKNKTMKSNFFTLINIQLDSSFIFFLKHKNMILFEFCLPSCRFPKLLYQISPLHIDTKLRK